MVVQIWVLGIVPALLIWWIRCAKENSHHTSRVMYAFFVALVLAPVFGGLDYILVHKPLLQAARRGDNAAVATYLRWGAEINGATDDGEGTALIVAAFENHPDTVRLLLDRGADVNQAAYYYSSPGHRNDIECATPLTPLQAAAGHPEIVAMLKKAEAKR